MPKGIKKENYLKVLKIYEEELIELKSSLKTAIAKEKQIDLDSLMHKVKGGAAAFGAEKLLEAAVLFETQSSEALNSKSLNALNQVEFEIENVIQEINIRA